MSYAFVFEDKAFGPDGPIADIDGVPLGAKDATSYNQQLEQQEIEHLKTGPERIMAYVRLPKEGRNTSPEIVTWPGTVIGTAWIGQRRRIGFGYNSYRRAVTVRIFGTLYNGWYFQSSGDYCRLKKAKKQEVKYRAYLQLP